MKERRLLNIDNPLIRDHRVLGRHVLPGMAYIDLLFQVFRKHGYDYRTLELRNVAIYEPLVVPGGQSVQVDILCSEEEGSKWRISVEGEVLRHEAGLGGERKRYITAEMRLVEPTRFDEAIESDSFVKSTTVFATGELYKNCRQLELVHDAFMQVRGEVYETDTAIYIKSGVHDAALSSAAHLMFHPVLIDGSVVCAGSALELIDPPQKRQLALPLFYERFRASQLLQRTCITRVQKALTRRVRELNYITLEFFDDAGHKIAELKDLASKWVRDPALIDPSRVNDTPKVAKSANRKMVGRSNAAAQSEIEMFVRRLIANKLRKPIEAIDPTVGYYELGLKSAALLELVQALEVKLDTTLPPTILFEYMTIAELCSHLASSSPPESHSEKTRIAVGKTQQPERRDDQLPRPGNATARTTDVSSNTRNVTGPIEKGVGASDIAIIGVSGRYPQANNLDEYWENVKTGKDCITEVPAARWDSGEYYDPERGKAGKTYCKWGGFIEGVDQFDPLFFNISPKEAQWLDPQARLYLETVWNLLESNGYTRALLNQRYQNQVGVYVGSMYEHYKSFNTELTVESMISIFSFCAIANRVSYFFGLKGPSVGLDTMCSSSAMAIHMACNALLRNECQIAIAGGVNLSIHPNKYIGLSQVELLASRPDSRSFTAGDGYVPGEGVGAVLLKPLSNAIKDKDSILAVIKATTANHSGRSNGFAVPDPKVQADLIESSLSRASIDARTISYVEAAANGSLLGDAIELTALSRVFRRFTADKQFCAIGSVKSNIGHAEAASGISQLTKVILQLQHQTLAPVLSSAQLNPKLEFESSPFVLQRELAEWKRPIIDLDGRVQEIPRRALINSFGYGGSYVNLLVEEYSSAVADVPRTTTDVTSPQVMVFSAKNKKQLRLVVGQMLRFMEHSETSLSDIAYTLQTGREAMECRLAFVATNMDEVRQGLNDHLAQTIDSAKELTTSLYTKYGEDRTTIQTLISGLSGEAFTASLIAEGDFEKIALSWTQGADIPWTLLHEEHEVHKVLLPTYPFERSRHWIEESNVGRRPVTARAPSKERRVQTPSIDESSYQTITVRISRIVADLLGMPHDQIQPAKELQYYGVDSVVGRRLMRELIGTFDVTISNREMLTLQTVDALSRSVEDKLQVRSPGVATPIEVGPLATDASEQNEPPMAALTAHILEQFRHGKISMEDLEMVIDRDTQL